MKLQCLGCGWTEEEPFDVGDACVCGGFLTSVPADEAIAFGDTTDVRYEGLLSAIVGLLEIEEDSHETHTNHPGAAA